MWIFCGERIEAGKGANARGRHFGRLMEEIAFTVVPKAYEGLEFSSECSSARSDSYRQARAAVPKRNNSAANAEEKLAGKAGVPSREATAKEARNHIFQSSYSLKYWDPEEKPILFLGSVFDANSLGKWIYDWTVFCYGTGIPIGDIAGEIWLLMIKLDEKKKRIEESPWLLTNSEDNGVLEDSSRAPNSPGENSKAVEGLRRIHMEAYQEK